MTMKTSTPLLSPSTEPPGARLAARVGASFAFSIVVAAITSACSSGAAGDAHSHGETHDDAHSHGGAPHGHDDDLPGSSVTHFTRGDDGTETELFVEFGPLIVGTETAFAAHLTDCGARFTAVGDGTLTVELAPSGEGGAATERFTVEKPTVPGIFRPVAKPTTSGPRVMRFVLVRQGREHIHDVGEVTVFASRVEAARAAASAPAAEDDGNAISFLKEQAWKLDFALAEVKKRPTAPTLRVFGEILPKSDGIARGSAPASGRVIADAKGVPMVGDTVERGATVLHLVPSLGGGGNLAAMLLRKEQAVLTLARAEREVARLKTLLEQGAVSVRRVDEAETDLAQARAESAGTERLLQQYEGVVRGGHAPGGIAIKSPIRGVLTDVPVVAGSFVEEGDTLFSVVDTGVLWLQARVPETERHQASVVYGGFFRLGLDEWFPIPETPSGHRPSTVLDASDRTFPLRIPIENKEGALTVGSHVVIDLAIAAPEDTLVVPKSSVVVEQGVNVIYVMVEGESFSRRVVSLGHDVGDDIVVISGIGDGERVVSVGAMYVKFAASGDTAPAHGHPH